MLKYSSRFPVFMAAVSHLGISPRPAQVSLGLSGLRYLGATAPPRRVTSFPPALLSNRLSFASSDCSVFRSSRTLPLRAASTLSRRLVRRSSDIDFRFMDIVSGIRQDARIGKNRLLP